MYIICYHDKKTIQTSFDEAESIEKWENSNPDKEIEYVFRDSSDVQLNHFSTQQDFELRCGIYGFEKSDYKKEFISKATGHRCVFIGFLPKNWKYPCRIYDKDDEKFYKVTPKYIKTNMN